MRWALHLLGKAKLTPALISLLGVILGGGFVGGVVAFRKAGAESGAIATETLIKVNQELRVELNRLNDEVKRLRAALEIRDII